MSTQNPRNRRKSISFTVTLMAFAVILLVQWTRGELGGFFGGASAPQPVTATAGPAPTQAQNTTAAKETPAGPATATTAPEQTPTTQSAAEDRATETPRPATSPTATANAPPAAQVSDLPPIAYEDLPPEGQETIALIEDGGPFPYSRDGITFQNRERILPRQPEGYYREYTVITPGENDRGARRIVTGEGGEMYYTDDHYDSFSEIIQ